MTEEQWIPESKEELMAAIKREWDALMNVAAKLEQGNKMITADEGGWSPKDNLAHLAEWMNALMGYHMDRRPPHEVMALPEETVVIPGHGAATTIGREKRFNPFLQNR